MSNDRCAICDATSSYDIRTNPENKVWRKHPFKEDPEDPTKLLCFECQGYTEDSDEYEEEEDDLDYLFFRQ